MSWHFFLTVAAGMFLVFAGQSNWKWFWNSHKQKGLIKLVGKKNAQIIITCIGVAVIIIGLSQTSR
ncbi:Imm17 family immunity protein [Prochlorococcus sp. AH-736-B08]|nr:Imm17 family immunity protein [Prochlorococcus sp. AH-736-B08]